jgi:hypothetical protein
MAEERSDVGKLRSRILDLFKKLFQGLGKKRFQYTPIRGNQVPFVEDYNNAVQDIEEDLGTLYAETTRVQELSRLTFNYNSVLSEELAKRAAAAASKVIDLRLHAGQLAEELVVAGDDFNDLSRVDLGFSTESPMAEVVPGQGIVTLKRTGADPAVDENTVVEVNPLNSNFTREPTEKNLRRFYEGHFYSWIGSSIPEGGQFHLEEKLSPLTKAAPNTVIDSDDEVHGIQSEIVADQEVQDLHGFQDLRQDGSDRPAGSPLLPSDIQIIDRGATEEERKAVRANMVDGNPDTVWQCEYATNTAAVTSLMTKLNQEEEVKAKALAEEKPVPNQSKIDELKRQLTPDAIRALLREDDIDTLDLEIEILLKVPDDGQRDVNFLTLSPNNFEDTAWLEVFDIAVAETADSAFVTIPGFDQGLFENTLTDEANEELEEGEYKSTLAPTRYTYRGQGIWTFPMLRASKIRFKIRQRVPIPSPYQVLAVQMVRSITRTKNTQTIINNISRLVKLDYLQTVQAMDDRTFLNEVVGTTQGGSSAGNMSSSTGAKWYYTLFFGLFGGGPKSQSTSLSHNDTGWSVQRSWLETRWDVIRYAVGIRDIGAFSYTFTETSELVSKNYTSPKEVLKVQVRVDEMIPAALSADRRWIEYYVSIDDGQEWLRINPLDHPTLFGDDGRIVPYTYTFNLEVDGPQGERTRVVTTLEPIRQVRFKAILKGDQEVADGDKITPVLKSYRVLITPRGSLSDAGF